MGRLLRGVVGGGLLLAGCVTPYGERVGAPNQAAPAAAVPTTPTPAPAETAEPPVEEQVAEPEKEEAPPTASGIDVEWTYFAGKVADEQLQPLGGPEVEEQVGPWKCTISKQETTTEGSAPVSRKRSVQCKHWGDATVGTAVTCDLDRTANDVTLSLGSDAVVIACKSK